MTFQWITVQFVRFKLVTQNHNQCPYFSMIHNLCLQWLRFWALVFVVHMICEWQNCCRWRFERDKGKGRRTREGACGTHTLSILFKDDGSSPESEERSRDCYFHLTQASAGEGLVFHFNPCCKTVIEAYSFHLHLSPLLLSLWSAACLPSVCASWHCWFLYDILSGILVLIVAHCWCTWQLNSNPKEVELSEELPLPAPLPPVRCCGSLTLAPPFNHCLLSQLSSFDSPFFSPVSVLLLCVLSFFVCLFSLLFPSC